MKYKIISQIFLRGKQIPITSGSTAESDGNKEDVIKEITKQTNAELLKKGIWLTNVSNGLIKKSEIIAFSINVEEIKEEKKEEKEEKEEEKSFWRTIKGIFKIKGVEFNPSDN